MTKDFFEVHEQEYEAMMEYITYEQDMAQQAEEAKLPTDEEMEEMARAFGES